MGLWCMGTSALSYCCRWLEKEGLLGTKGSPCHVVSRSKNHLCLVWGMSSSLMMYSLQKNDCSHLSSQSLGSFCVAHIAWHMLHPIKPCIRLWTKDSETLKQDPSPKVHVKISGSCSKIDATITVWTVITVNGAPAFWRVSSCCLIQLMRSGYLLCFEVSDLFDLDFMRPYQNSMTTSFSMSWLVSPPFLNALDDGIFSLQLGS